MLDLDIGAVPHGLRSSFRQQRPRGSGLPAQRPVRPAPGAYERLGRVRSRRGSSARTPEPPAGRVNDGVFINPVREGPRAAAGREAGGCTGGRWEARGIDRARSRVSGPGRRARSVLLGDPPPFGEDDTDPHGCVKPLDAVALPSRAATAACRIRHGPTASCSAPMASRLRCLSTVRPGMPPWPPRLPHTPRQSRLRCGTPSPSPRAPRTFLKVSRGRRLPYLMAMSPAIGRMAHRVRSAPAARRSSGMAHPCPRGCISRRSSAILAYRANCDLAPGRRHPRAMSGAPAPDFHRLSGLPVCRDGSRPRRHRAAPTWPLR